MATIKAIEARSVHQIQSGQVIVDLCSVVKELVENSLDAGASSIDVRFKGQGLEYIEVQDNGSGISSNDYATIALKHYTSKLATYDDLGSLSTFGFRGEALSSLCALSKFYIVTARENEAPKATRLDFEISGQLKGTNVAAGQKGTTVAVENLFANLPVRRRELEKNVKREYSKVLGVLHAYACISTNVRFAVSNQVDKGKTVVFSTKANPTTRENIANVYGAKTISALVSLDLNLELELTTTGYAASKMNDKQGHVHVAGHISKPIFGEGRQTPDRQMFFVNSRPCGLPQVAKAINEVYRSYNITQSPFIFANFEIDTNAYDVNVSPDKRTILLHDQAALLETLKESLVKLFQSQDQTIPHSQLRAKNMPAFRPLTVSREHSLNGPDNDPSSMPHFLDRLQRSDTIESLLPTSSISTSVEDLQSNPLLENFVSRNVKDRSPPEQDHGRNKSHRTSISRLEIATEHEPIIDSEEERSVVPRPIQDFNARIASQQIRSRETVGLRSAVAEGVEKTGEEEDRPAMVSARDIMESSVQDVSEASSSNDMMLDVRSVDRSLEISAFAPSVSTNKRRRLNDTQPESDSQRPSQISQFARFAAAGSNAIEMMPSSTNGQKHHDVENGRPSSLDSDYEAYLSEHSQENDKRQKGRGEAPDEVDNENSDDEYIDEGEQKTREEARVQELVREAEATAMHPTQQNSKRTAGILRSGLHKDSTLKLMQTLDITIANVEEQVSIYQRALQDCATKSSSEPDIDEDVLKKTCPEDRLSLIIDKCDFAGMRIVGQFNLGFILAVRSSTPLNSHHKDDLFIIDQHASDEIYNFSRLSLSTTLTPQPLVVPHILQLTAIEEETIMSHQHASLAANGFTISIDESGASPVGQRCSLLTLPTSRDTVFDTRDLEELLVLLSEVPAPPSSRESQDDHVPHTPILLSSAAPIVRPSKVRRMLAMRACRSSIMVGRTLTGGQMRKVVRHMGEIERPWNCPHGRPTMRHLAGLEGWEGWKEGAGLGDDEDEAMATDWRGWLNRM